MGSKNLKAIAVRGTNPPQFADKEKITQMARSGAKRSREHSVAKTLREYGTAAVVAGNQAMGGLPTRNWTSGTFEHADSISGAAMTETILQKNEACLGMCDTLQESR